MEYNIEDGDLPSKRTGKPLGRPKGTKKGRMTNAERRAFLNDSIQMILETHMSYKDYVYYCKTEKKLSAAQANEYWLASWKVVKEKFELEKDKIILKHTQKYWEIYEQAIENRDLSNARGVLNDLNKLLGLNEPDKVEVRGTSIKLNFGDTDV